MSATPCLDALGEVVRRRAAWGASGGSERAFRETAARLAVMHVQLAVSSAEQRVLGESERMIHDRERRAEMALRDGWGICMDHALTAEAVLFRAGVPTRSVGLTWGSAEDQDSHAAMEVEWDGAWHFFDVTWGTYWVGGASEDVLSFEELRSPAVASARRASNEICPYLGAWVSEYGPPWNAYLDSRRPVLVTRWPKYGSRRWKARTAGIAALERMKLLDRVMDARELASTRWA